MLQLPDRSPAGADPPGTVPKLKYVVTLQGGQDFANTSEVAIVVASTLPSSRLANPMARPFEVFVDENHGFDHLTVIDCRWIFTVQQRHLRIAKHPQLPDHIMREISEALAVGLQL
jgi:hypothetical protein